MTARTIRWLSLTLLAGTVLLGVGALLHPLLPFDVRGQLAVIARTPSWQAIHVLMLIGSLLLLLGLVGQLETVEPPARRALLAVLGVIAVGLLLNAQNIAFMAHVGTGDAALYAGGHNGAAMTFASGHSASLAIARVGNAIVAAGCLALGVLEWRSARQLRLMAILAWVAGVGGMVGVVAFDPASRGAVAAVALFAAWAGLSAILLLRSGRTRRMTR